LVTNCVCTSQVIFSLDQAHPERPDPSLHLIFNTRKQNWILRQGTPQAGKEATSCLDIFNAAFRSRLEHCLKKTLFSNCSSLELISALVLTRANPTLREVGVSCAVLYSRTQYSLEKVQQSVGGVEVWVTD
jgi:hypothetical protein